MARQFPGNGYFISGLLSVLTPTQNKATCPSKLLLVLHRPLHRVTTVTKRPVCGLKFCPGSKPSGAHSSRQ